MRGHFATEISVFPHGWPYYGQTTCLIGCCPLTQQVIFGVFDPSGTKGGAVSGLQMVLEKVYLPSIKNCQNWGELSDKTGQITQRNFFDNCRAFVECLQSKLLCFILILVIKV